MRIKRLQLYTKQVSLWALLILSACSQIDGNQNARTRNKARGEARYGGIISLNFTNSIKSLFPLNSVYTNSVMVMSQVYEGLVYLDPSTSTVKPCLAESWEVNEEGNIYTFHIRKGVRFHNHEIFESGTGRELTAYDVKFCFQRLCEPAENNQMYSFLTDIIKGGQQYFEEGGQTLNPENELEGVKVIDDYTLSIELEYPFLGFLKRLTHSCCYIFPRELYSLNAQMDYNCVGTGPFLQKKAAVEEVIILGHNSNYWKKDSLDNQLPYIDGVRFTFLDETAQVKHFLKGNIDLVSDLSFEDVQYLETNKEYSAFEFESGTKPVTSIQYYAFQTQHGLFSDRRIRKAFNMAVDKKKIVDEALGGSGIVADKGFVPPVMPGYPAEEVEGLSYHPEKARQLLAEAGYPSGEGFPVVTMQMDDGGPRVFRVAEKLQEMLTTNLGVPIELSILSREKHFSTVEMGSVALWRDNWTADYPDPENFLQLFYDGGQVPELGQPADYLNIVRFQNTSFDSLLEASIKEQNPERRMELFVKADQLIIDEAPVLPLYYDYMVWYKNKGVQNLQIRSDGVFFLHEVYLDQ